MFIVYLLIVFEENSKNRVEVIASVMVTITVTNLDTVHFKS